MSASTYNEIRRIIFSTANNPKRGFALANEWLEKTYKNKLGSRGYAGLKAELYFYEKHRHEFKLTVAGDMGEHADFSGMYGTDATRFDVTTNLDFKKFHNYEPHMGDGLYYKIALLDKNNFEIIDILNLAFPRCQWCEGYLIPCITLLDQNYNRHGESQGTNDQLLMNICSECNEIYEENRYTHGGLSSPQEYFDNFDVDFESEVDYRAKSTEEYCIDNYKYFRREFNDNLMAIAQHNYITTGRKGEGYWAIDFMFKNKAISNYLPEDIECSHEI